MTREEAMQFIKREDDKFNHTRDHQWKFNVTVWTLIVLGIVFIVTTPTKIPFGLTVCARS